MWSNHGRLLLLFISLIYYHTVTVGFLWLVYGRYYTGLTLSILINTIGSVYYIDMISYDYTYSTRKYIII